jgi:hypothetical protein
MKYAAELESRFKMWVLPTLGRPAICQNALNSIIEVGCSTPGIVVIDGDPDPRYRDLTLPSGWRQLANPHNRGYLDTFNGAFQSYPDEPWYGLLNDDFLVRTPGWDERLVAAAGALGFSSSNDLWQSGQPAPGKPSGRMCGALVFGGDMLRALGWWAPPGLFHCYADDAWELILARLGNRIYLRDVIVEHRQDERDDTNRHAYSKLEADRLVWERFEREHMPAAIERVAQARGVEVRGEPVQGFKNPAPAILTLTASNNQGYVDIPGATGTGAFAVSTVNIGSDGIITVSTDTGAVTLPVSVTICQTDPATGACLGTPAANVTTTITANATPTFGIFVAGLAAVADLPGVNRVFVSFTDANGVLCGETSVAVRTQ